MSDGNRENTMASVQIEEIKCTIRELPLVTKLSPVRAHKSHGAGWGVSLTCSACEEYDSCGKKQEEAVQVSSVHPTEWGTIGFLIIRIGFFIIDLEHYTRCTDGFQRSNQTRIFPENRFFEVYTRFIFFDFWFPEKP
jgi:hypothetical protein